MTDIQRLDDQTVERIAAGEVVERPASVVKELVENASTPTRAGSTWLWKLAEPTGSRPDDGVGMDREAVKTAVEEHTTSKIRDIADRRVTLSHAGSRRGAARDRGGLTADDPDQTPRRRRGNRTGARRR